MPWQKKAGTPDYVNATQFFATAITGTSEDWLLQHLVLLGDRTLDVNALCAAGPFSCESLDALDFLGFLGGGRVGVAAGGIGLIPKLACFIDQRVFSAMCEQTMAGFDCASIGTRNTWIPGASDNMWYFEDIPTGFTHMRVGVVNDNGHPGQCAAIAYGYSDGPPTNLGVIAAFSGVSTGFIGGEYPIQPTATKFAVRCDPNGATFEVWFCNPGATEIPPEDIPEPEGVLPPTTRDYPDIAALGAELDNVERKLHWLIDAQVSSQISNTYPMVPSEESTPVIDDSDIPLDESVVGVLVVCSDLGNQTDERFGEPRQLHRLGRVVIGNDEGWLPPIEITVSPMLIASLPAGMTKARVHVLPPATAIVTLMKRQMPAG